MQALLAYLAETGTAADDFARLIGVEAGAFRRMLEGAAPVTPGLAQRIVDAAGGALDLGDILGGDIAPLRAFMKSGFSEIDVDRLAAILAHVIPPLVGGARRKGDEYLPRLAADAAANTYAALSTITTRRGEARLCQALQPVFEEILEESSAAPSRRALAAEAARKTVQIYFQAPTETPSG